MSVTATSSRRHPSTHTGKVARLPYEIREELNRRMRDGARGPALIKWLAKTDPSGKDISPQNISNWRKGGYRDWLTHQDRIEAIRKRSEMVRRELEAGGFSILDQQIYELAGAMEDVEPVKAAIAIAALKGAVTAEKRADIAARRTQIAEDRSELDRERFEVDTCQRFLKWFNDHRARSIAESSATNSEKIDALRAAYFADVNALEQSGEVELPK